jgi:O-antigen/teichoic acid export membrane protein
VNGLDLIFVSHFQFASTGYYSIATSLLNVVATLNGAIFSALIPATSVLHANQQYREIGQIVIRTTRYGLYVLVVAVLPFFLLGRVALGIWLGDDYAVHTLPLLLVLLCASIIRFSGNPYSVAMLGTGQHRHNTVGPFVEGFINVAASIGFAEKYGAIGVAYGTLVGSVAGMACHIFYNVPRTRDIQMSVSEYGFAGLIAPLARLLPMTFVALLPGMHAMGWLSLPWAIAAGVILSMTTVYLVVQLEGWQGRVVGMSAALRRAVKPYDT